MEDRTPERRANVQKPRTPSALIEQAIRLGRAGKDRELLAFADRFGKEFLDQFTAEEWSQLDGMLESAQMAVDLDDWSAAQSGQRRAADAAPAVPPNAVEATAP